VKHAIQTHSRDFIAIAVLVVLALATVGYILEHQPAFMLGRSYYPVKAVFSSNQGRDSRSRSPGSRSV